MFSLRSILSMSLILALGIPAQGAQAPAARLEATATNLTVTESYALTITATVPPLPGRLKDMCPFAKGSESPFDMLNPFEERASRPQLRGQLPDPTIRFTLGQKRVGENWVMTLTSDSARTTKAGALTIGPLQIIIPVYTGEAVRGFFGIQRQTRKCVLDIPSLTLTVTPPPERDRPTTWCGGIGKSLSVKGTLDANVCTAGDPLLYTLTATGDIALEELRAPDLAHLVKDASFRIDTASLKTSTLANGKRWVWRVRALKAGTQEFPSIEIAWYDVTKRQYQKTHTEIFPVQVKAGVQAALGATEESEETEDTYPMPDGIDLDFTRNNTTDFTLQHAIALACKATDAKAFALAADAYARWLEGRKITWWDALMQREAPFNARHFANLAALETLAERPKRALAAEQRAEWFVGETPALRRTVCAARARLLKDPRAEASTMRLLMPFFFRLNLLQRVGFVLGILLITFVVFAVASKLGKKLALVILCCAPLASFGQFNFSFNNFSNNNHAKLKAEVALDPPEIVVGQPGAFVIRFSDENKTIVEPESLRISGLPSDATGEIVYGNLSQTSENVFRVGIRFLKPYQGTIRPILSGMAGTEKRSQFGVFKSTSNFRVVASPKKILVMPLPEAGKSDAFSGSIGRNFHLSYAFTPNRVRPGDLVKLRYTLNFEGYCPSNAVPNITGLAGFKTYDLKEIARTPSTVAWEQVIIPESVNATNAPRCSLNVFDLATRHYRTIQASEKRLTFLSHEKASTENKSVLIDDAIQSSAPAQGTNQAITLRFAPAESAPIVITVKSGTILRETGRHGNWTRFECDAGAGWTH